MPSDDRTAETTDDQPSTEMPSESEASAATEVSAESDTPEDLSLPEGFGEVPDDREGSRWGGYALAGLLAIVFLIGLVRVAYPNASILVIGTLLALFGVLIGVLAARGRLHES